MFSFIFVPVLAILVVPWFLGMASIFKGFSSNSSKERKKMISDLESAADMIHDPQQLKGYLTAIDNLRGDSNKINSRAGSPKDIEMSELYHEKLGSNQNGSNLYHGLEADDKSIEARADKNHLGLRSLENINILLYLGSFLIVVAASIFVGFNYQLMSGISKVLFLLIFTLIFYIIGLYLYIGTNKMKPAGAIFTTIGVILFPLNGLAFFKFVCEGSFGNTVWFVTSILTLIFYSIALKYTKNIYLNYLSAFVCLSVFESFVSLFDVPIYYFFWGMVLFSMIVVLCDKFTTRKLEISKPLLLSASIVSPLSILCSLCMTMEFGIFAVGVNIILAAIYYFMLYFISDEEKARDIYLTLFSVLLPLGFCAILSNNNAKTISYVMLWLIFSASYILLTKISGRFLSEGGKVSLTALGAMAASVACILAIGDNSLLLTSLIFSIVICISSYYFNKNILCLGISLIALLCLPKIIAIEISSTGSVEYTQTILYLIISMFLLWVDYYLRKNETTNASVMIFFAYIISTVIVLISSFYCHNSSIILLVELLMAASYFTVASYKNNKIFDYIGALLFYLSSVLIADKISLDGIKYIWILFTMALAFYFSGMLKSDDEERSRHWRFVGLAGLAVVTILFYANEANSIKFILLLALFGIACYYESFKEDLKIAKYISVAILVAALEFGLDYMQIDEQHVYTTIWAGYFGVLAYINHCEQEYTARDSLSVIALILLTIPIFCQAAFGYENQQIYGIVLGIESIIIMLLGMNYKYKLMTWWGSIALSIIVLDQTKDAIFALPKWIIVGVVGLLFLGTAVYLLSKNKSEKS